VSVVVAALVSWLAVGLFQGLARRRGWGQRVRTDGPGGHLVKEGTPTMGGVPFTLVIFLLWLAFVGLPGAADAKGWAVMGMAFGMGLIGLVDDILVVRSRALGLPRGGLKAREKFPLQFLVALVFAVVVSRDVSMTGVTAVDVLLYAVAVVGAVNAVNFTDGLDGLASGVVAICLLPLLALSPVAGLTVGALAGYLWFNSRPASIFMGDAGSHALGGILAGVFITQGWLWVLPVAAIIPVLEILSVVIQVVYFRRTGGRRVFKMTPIHHHFELSGWQEGKVTGRFWVITAVATALAWALQTGAR
jgi:phospho-N-acetylmuramoyl-pentapeptide-transferase